MLIIIILCSVHQNLDGIGEENEPMDTEVHTFVYVAAVFVVMHCGPTVLTLTSYGTNCMLIYYHDCNNITTFVTENYMYAFIIIICMYIYTL